VSPVDHGPSLLLVAAVFWLSMAAGAALVLAGIIRALHLH
jgi:hypothetical protein